MFFSINSLIYSTLIAVNLSQDNVRVLQMRGRKSILTMSLAHLARNLVTVATCREPVLTMKEGTVCFLFL